MDWLEGIAKIISAFAWPSVVLIGIIIVREDLFSFLKGRKFTYKNQTKGMELVVEELEKQISLTRLQRAEIENLTANEIWALDSFNKEGIENKHRLVSQMNPASKVMTKTFLEAGLVELAEGKVIVTSKGKKILDIADNILKTENLT